MNDKIGVKIHKGDCVMVESHWLKGLRSAKVSFVDEKQKLCNVSYYDGKYAYTDWMSGKEVLVIKCLTE